MNVCFETFGCRLNTISDDTRRAAEGGRASRPWHFRDIGQAIGHGMSFLATRGAQGDLGARKEHFPKSVAKALEESVKLARNNPAADNALRIAAALERETPTAGGSGLRQLQRNIDIIKGSPEFKPYQYAPFLELIEAAITALPNHDRLDVRLGNEVVID